MFFVGIAGKYELALPNKKQFLACGGADLSSSFYMIDFLTGSEIDQILSEQCFRKRNLAFKSKRMFFVVMPTTKPKIDEYTKDEGLEH